MEYSRNSWWDQMPPVTKNLLVINLAVWLFDMLAQRVGVDLTGLFGLVNWSAASFQGTWSFHIWQPFTYMFLHANFWHLFCNMFAVLMFAPAIERQWGSQRFLTYYMVSGVGAALVQQLVWMLTIGSAMSVTIGASGAVFGILFAFGWLFPQVKMFLLFIPIPIPSRYFVALYAIFELFEGISSTAGDNVAHFAHLGGMLFGWLLLLYWKKSGAVAFEPYEHDSEIWQRIKRRFTSRKKKETEQTTSRTYHYQAPVDDAGASSRKSDDEVNRLLDKIKHSGYDSLTQEEKDRLFKH